MKNKLTEYQNPACLFDIFIVMEQQAIYQVASNWLLPMPHTGFHIYLFSVPPSESSLDLYLLQWFGNSSALECPCSFHFTNRMLAPSYWHDSVFHWPGSPSIPLTPGYLLSSPSHLDKKEILFWLRSPTSCAPGFQYQISIFLYLGAVSNNMPGLVQRNKHWETLHTSSLCAQLVLSVPLLFIGQRLQGYGEGEKDGEGDRGSFWGPLWSLLSPWQDTTSSVLKPPNLEAKNPEPFMNFPWLHGALMGIE